MSTMPEPVSPEQFQVPHSALISQCLQAKGLSAGRADWLIRLGAVYAHKERVTRDMRVEKGEWIRFHPSPRRFPQPRAQTVELVANFPEFVVAHKPAGLPVHPTCDNALENLKSILSYQLGYPVYPGHRLDIPTSGLLVLAKNKDFLRRFQRALEAHEVKKEYIAKTRKLVPEGLHQHYMAPGDRAPKQVSSENHEGWKLCELLVRASIEKDGNFLSRIQLITGRHHQIRAQLSALGTPILGDTLYGDVCDNSKEEIGLTCTKLSFFGYDFQLPEPEEATEL